MSREAPRRRVLAWPGAENAYNAYTSLLYAPLRDEPFAIETWTPIRALWHRADVWHIHFPDALVSSPDALRSGLKVAAFSVLLTLARWRSTRIVWTVHDLDSPEGHHPRLSDWLYRFFVPRVDALISLSETGLRESIQRLPGLRGKPAYMIPHGHYRGAYPDQLPRGAARERLGLPEDAVVLLSFGRIRCYKDIPQLITTFRKLPRRDIILLIAGEPIDQNSAQAVVAAAGDDARVRLVLELIPADRVQAFLRAADLVVLPYRRVLHSGALMLALSFDRPVLASDTGALPEYSDRFGRDWIRIYSGTLSAEIIVQAIEWCRRIGRPASCDLESLGWPEFAAQTRTVYESLVPSPTPTREPKT